MVLDAVIIDCDRPQDRHDEGASIVDDISAGGRGRAGAGGASVELTFSAADTVTYETFANAVDDVVVMV